VVRERVGRVANEGIATWRKVSSYTHEVGKNGGHKSRGQTRKRRGKVSPEGREGQSNSRGKSNGEREAKKKNVWQE